MSKVDPIKVPLGAPQMTPRQAKRIVGYVERLAGVRSGMEKPEFVRSRLAKRMEALELTSFDQYLALLEGPDKTDETKILVELLTTHTTSFFREAAHFSWIEENALPALIEEGAGISRPIVFWSAAVSTGAELWTAAMVFEEFRVQNNLRLKVELLGTDVSRKVLRRAATARFNMAEIKGIPEHLRKKYLLRSAQGYAGKPVYKIAPRLQENARLSYANLVKLDAGFQPKADIVMLRNVLIYFDADTQAKVARDIVARMRDGAFLFVAHSENLRDRVSGLKTVGNAVYQKVGV